MLLPFDLSFQVLEVADILFRFVLISYLYFSVVN